MSNLPIGYFEPDDDAVCPNCEELQKENDRLNKWADGFSDAQLKERKACEMLLRELRAENEELKADLESETKVANSLRFVCKRNDELLKDIAKLKADLVGVETRAMALRNAITPFAKIVSESSGRIPVEKLSMADWHTLVKAYKPPICASSYQPHEPPRGNYNPKG